MKLEGTSKKSLLIDCLDILKEAVELEERTYHIVNRSNQQEPYMMPPWYIKAKSILKKSKSLNL
jgi:hypothetical protein